MVLGVAYLYVYIHIQHAKAIGAQFFLLGGKLIVVWGQFGQKVPRGGMGGIMDGFG